MPVPRQIAVSYLAVNYHALKEKQAGRPATSYAPPSPIDYLRGICWDRDALQSLVLLAAEAKEGLSMNNEQLGKRLQPLIGTFLIDGKPFEFTPDPWREKHYNPEKAAQREFAEHFIALYIWLGGKPTVHKHGRSLDPTAFMRFMTLIVEAIPSEFRPKGDSLTRQAISLLEAERRAA